MVQAFFGRVKNLEQSSKFIPWRNLKNKLFIMDEKNKLFAMDDKI